MNNDTILNLACRQLDTYSPSEQLDWLSKRVAEAKSALTRDVDDTDWLSKALSAAEANAEADAARAKLWPA